MDPWRLGGLEQALRQDDHGEVPRRIDESGRAEATVPAECAAGWIDGDNGLTQPPLRPSRKHLASRAFFSDGGAL